jgi:hypothetical protein
MDQDEKQHHQDITRKYVFDQHRYALGFLKLFGWTGLMDSTYIHRIIMQTQITGIDVYHKCIKPACLEFQIQEPSLYLITKTPTEEYLNLILKYINKILLIMYGINISSTKNDPDMYCIRRNNLFTFDSAESIRTNKPLIRCGKEPDVVTELDLIGI